MIKEVYQTKTVDEALDLLDRYKEKSKIIGGGTDLIIDLRKGKITPEIIVDISDIEEMSEINENGGYIEIGGAVTFKKMIEGSYFNGSLKGLKEAAQVIGSPQIRNRGTVGGNICNASPAADIVPPLLALDSQLIMKSKNQDREIPLKKLYLGKGKINLKSEELLYKIKFKKPEESCGLGFCKLGLRKALAISRMCISVFLQIDDEGLLKEVKVSSGSLGQYPLREEGVEAFLKNKKLTQETIESAVLLLQRDIKERLKGRTTVNFKSEAVKGTFLAAIEKAREAWRTTEL